MAIAARLVGLVIVLAVLLPGCALSGLPANRARASPEASSIASGAAKPAIVREADDAGQAARMIAELARDADVVYLGEQHDNPAHHAHQLEVLRALLELGSRPAIAFEMLEEGQQPEVDLALAESLSQADLADRLGWRARGWPDFAMYWPLFDLAARRQLPVLAIDLGRDTVRRIARDGRAALGESAALVGSLLPPNAAREAAIGRTMREVHCDVLPEARVPAMVDSWHARNVTMARRLAAALDRTRGGPGRPVVVIVGRGHQDIGGLPDQLAALRPRTHQLIVSLVEPSADLAAVTALADVVWITPAVERGDPCASLRAPR